MKIAITDLLEIPGFPGYFAHSSGAIYSLAKRWPGGPRRLKAKLDRYGYLIVGPYVAGKKRYVGVHVLVLRAFKGPGLLQQQARHFDGNKVNNLPGNLLWGTQIENSRDKYRHNTMPLGQRHINAKISDAQAQTIRQLAAIGETAKTIGSSFGLSRSQVYRIIHGKCFSHLPGAIRSRIEYAGDRHHARRRKLETAIGK